MSCDFPLGCHAVHYGLPTGWKEAKLLFGFLCYKPKVCIQYLIFVVVVYIIVVLSLVLPL